MNKVILIGRTTKAIELKTTTTGKSVANFSLAVKREFKNADGEYDTDFINCIAFNKLAERISNYVRKGDLIAIDGKIQTGNYTDKEGNKKYTTDIVVNDVEFLTPKKQDAEVKQDMEFEEVDPFAEELPFN